jgi:hypothetical protein
MLFRLLADVIETYRIEALIEADSAEAAEEAYNGGDDEAIKGELILDGGQYDRTIVSVDPYIGTIIAEAPPSREELFKRALAAALIEIEQYETGSDPFDKATSDLYAWAVENSTAEVRADGQLRLEVIRMAIST